MVVTALKETPLAAVHKSLGARMVEFGGWNMPVRYKSDIQEHQAVRNKVGLFDVSHMGEFLVSGDDAHDFVQYMIANDVNRLSKPNMALYTQFVNEEGGTVDDLIVYRRENDFLLVVNASNMEKDWNWVQKHAGKYKNLNLKNVSNDTALLALQGPKAVQLLSDVVGKDLSGLPSFSYSQEKADGLEISFGRTGYTGEDGFEIFCATGEAEKLWNLLLAKGEKYGIEPCGLGARDTLRLEAGLPLYGHELDDQTGPLEAGLGWSVKLEKGDFIGRDKLKAQKENGVPKQCVCLRSEGKALPRQGYEVWSGGKQVGVVTSGSTGIHVGYPIAFAYVPPEFGQRRQSTRDQNPRQHGGSACGASPLVQAREVKSGSAGGSPAARGINAVPTANIDEQLKERRDQNYDHSLNEIVRLLRIVWSEIERVDFERSHQLCDELIARIYVRFDSVCVIAERVALAASAVVAMHMTGRILPCISLPEGN